MTTFSIIIPYYNNLATIFQTLDSLKTLTLNDFEVIIIDDCSTNKLTLTKTYPFPIQLITNQENRGGGYTRNQGAKLAKGSILLFTDSDVLLPPNTLTKISHSFATDSTLTAVIGSYTKETPATGTVTKFKNLFHHFNHQTAKENATIFWTGCGAIKADIFKAINMFSEDIKITPIEDIELGYRLNKQGYKIKLVKDLLVTHLKQYTLKEFIISDLFSRAIPWTYIIRLQKTIKNDLNTSLKYQLSIIATFIILLSLVTMPIVKSTLFILLFSLSLLLYLNFNFFYLCYKENGKLFFLKALLLILIHFVCCGLGFLKGLTTNIYAAKLENTIAEEKN